MYMTDDIKKVKKNINMWSADDIKKSKKTISGSIIDSIVNRVNNLTDSANSSHEPDSENILNANATAMTGKHFNKNKIMIVISMVSILGIYLLIGQLIACVKYMAEILIFFIMIFKIGMHIFSSDSCIAQSPSDINLTENKNVKIINKKSRSNYTGTLLRQSFIIAVIRIIIVIIDIFDSIPLLNMFSIGNYVHLVLLVLSFMILTPTSIINSLLSKLTKKISFLNSNILLNCPLSDRIIFWIKKCIGNAKLSAVQVIGDIIIKYDDNTILDRHDGAKLLDALDQLGVSQEYLKHIGIDDKERIAELYSTIKLKIEKIMVRTVQMLLDGNIEVEKIFTDIVKNTNNKNTNKNL